MTRRRSSLSVGAKSLPAGASPSVHLHEGGDPGGRAESSRWVPACEGVKKFGAVSSWPKRCKACSESRDLLPPPLRGRVREGGAPGSILVRPSERPRTTSCFVRGLIKPFVARDRGSTRRPALPGPPPQAGRERILALFPRSLAGTSGPGRSKRSGGEERPTPRC